MILDGEQQCPLLGVKRTSADRPRDILLAPELAPELPWDGAELGRMTGEDDVRKGRKPRQFRPYSC